MLCRTQSIRRDMCFGSSEREMTINHQVVIGIVWESSAQQQRDGGAEESSVEELLPCLSVTPPWLRHHHSFPVPLQPYAPYFIFLPQAGQLPPALGTAPTSPGRDAFASFHPPLPQAEELPIPFLPPASLSRLQSYFIY